MTSVAPAGARPGDRWRQGLLDAAAAVPDALREMAGAKFSLEPEMFRWRPEVDAKQPVRPSRLRALEALPETGAVLDVGVGGGASSLGLAPKAGLIVGVDRLEGMLESFRASAGSAGVAVQSVLGAWPDVAGQVEPVDVAVCHHAIYGVEEIEQFLTVLTAKARCRVVLEISEFAPPSGLSPLWKEIHGAERPDRVVADEVHTIAAAMELGVEREDTVIPPRPREVTPELVAFARRRLLVGEDRDEEIAGLLRARQPQEQRVTALWWPGRAQPGGEVCPVPEDG